jgi:hypothetical protein
MIRSPLEYLPLVARKAVKDGFRRAMLVPRWTRRLWWPELELAAHSMVTIAPGNLSARKWDAVLVVFSLEAAQFALALKEGRSPQRTWQRPETPPQSE